MQNDQAGILKSSRPPAIFLMGPTASGKTKLAIALKEQFQLEIISVDSAQVYRGMDIGTAKPDKVLLKQAPHALIDIRDPARSYSAAEFREDALAEMTSIHGRGHVPLLAGGTMLYFNALSGGLADLPAANLEVRARIEKKAQQVGWQTLHAELAARDPETAARIHPNDPQRIQRALEVIELSGQKMSDLHRQQHELSSEEGAARDWGYRVLKIVVCPQSRQELHERIERRFYQMLDEGFMDEMKVLKERGDLNPDLPSMRCVGYRQAWSYLEGELTFEEMCQKTLAATRQLAKRQLTWLRRESSALWYDLEVESAPETVFELVSQFLEN
jgi:tRNA dimethylallyltransferase